MLLDDVEDRFPEGPHELPSEMRAYPLDHARGQVLLYALPGGGGDAA